MNDKIDIVKIKIQTKMSKKINNTIFINKDIKIRNLEQVNKKLAQILSEELALFDECGQKLKDINNTISKLQEQNSILQIEEMMVQNSCQNMQKKIGQNNPGYEQIQKKISQLQEQNIKFQENLHKLILKQQNDKITIKRYKAQQKIERMMTKSQKNINNIYESLQKNYQNYQKNLKILQNKLQSKHRYLEILRKKQQKEKTQNNNIKSQKTGLVNAMNSKKYSLQGLKSNYRQPLTKNIMQTSKKQNMDQVKRLNDIIRKKNVILSQKK